MCKELSHFWSYKKEHLKSERFNIKRKNVIQEKSFEFALSIVQLYQKLVEEREYVISRQLLKSGTSIGANVEEATAGQTKKDFIAKMAIASKEARETRYWLRLLEKSDLTKIDITELQYKIEEIIKILTKIVKSSQQNLLDK